MGPQERSGPRNKRELWKSVSKVERYTEARRGGERKKTTTARGGDIAK